MMDEKLGGDLPDAALWKEMEKQLDQALLKKGTFTTARRYFGYATEKKEEFECLRISHKNIVFTDHEKIPDMKAIEGTQSLWEVAGGHEPHSESPEKWMLQVAAMPCSCVSCRGKSKETCEYIAIREPKQLVMREYTEQEKAENRERAKKSGHICQIQRSTHKDLWKCQSQQEDAGGKVEGAWKAFDRQQT